MLQHITFSYTEEQQEKLDKIASLIRKCQVDGHFEYIDLLLYQQDEIMKEAQVA